MQNDENTNDLEVETKDEETVEDTVVDAEDKSEDSQSETDDTSEEQELTTEQELAKARAEAAKYKRLLQKEQKKAKPDANQSKSSEARQNGSPSTSVEEVVLKANGMSDELLKTLKKIAAVTGTSLLDAQKDELFVAAKEKFEKEEKSKRSSMGASKGSAKSTEKPSFTKPGLSDEEHKKLWEQTVGS